MAEPRRAAAVTDEATRDIIVNYRPRRVRHPVITVVLVIEIFIIALLISAVVSLWLWG